MRETAGWETPKQSAASIWLTLWRSIISTSSTWRSRPSAGGLAVLDLPDPGQQLRDLVMVGTRRGLVPQQPRRAVGLANPLPRSSFSQLRLSRLPPRSATSCTPPPTSPPPRASLRVVSVPPPASSTAIVTPRSTRAAPGWRWPVPTRTSPTVSPRSRSRSRTCPRHWPRSRGCRRWHRPAPRGRRSARGWESQDFPLRLRPRWPARE